LAATSCAQSVESVANAPITEADRRIVAAAEGIEQRIAALRERPFLRPVAKQVYSREQLGAAMAKQLDEEDAKKELAQEQTILRAIGLLPRDVDLGELYRGLLTSQIAGFYDPKDKALRCISSDVALVQRVTMVHEIYHSLQDQYVPLEKFMEEVKGDAAIARKALVEGDAQNFTMDVYAQAHRDEMAGDLQSEDPKKLAGFALEQALAQSAIPPYFADELTWPYLAGATFVHAVREAGGWPAVDAAFTTKPPRSSEEILHPKKYLDGSDPPLEVHAFVPSFARDWTATATQTMGEASIAALLLHLGDDVIHSQRGSEGWGGDELTVVESPAHGSLLCWSTRWDRERDAAEFYAAWRHLLTQPSRDSAGDVVTPFVGELAAGATRLGAVARGGPPVPADFAGELRLPAGVTASVAVPGDGEVSFLFQRGLDVLLVRGRPLRDNGAARFATVAEEFVAR
jgi:hypothetical protein